MGTRGIVGFAVDGQIKASYNHACSYPTSLGLEILEWARGADMEATAARAREIKLLGDDPQPPTPSDRARLAQYENPSVGGASTDASNQWYKLLRWTQGDPGAMLNAGVMIDSLGFVTQNCLWGYIVNLDAGQLEVYVHDCYAMPTLGSGLLGDLSFHDQPSRMQLLAAWPLDELPRADVMSELEALEEAV